MKQPYTWDNYSDQPYQLKDKSFKKKMRKKEFYSLFKTFLTSIIVLPLSLILMPFIRRKEVKSKEFFCIGVDYQREPGLTIELLEEIPVERVLVRFKLWEMDTLHELKEFIKALGNKKITLKILQDREHVENLELLEKDLETIFSSLSQHVDIFEIGSTINRAKWGFFSVDEYSRFYKTAYDLKISKFPDIKLIGSGVIDFEYHFTAHTIFNFFKYRYDGVSALLYVDRRGAPENTQLGFSLSDKIAFLSTIVWSSPKVGQELHVTEVNWPISGTSPYAPTSEHECVDEELYADFMLRYYLLTFASQQVDSVSWHQLIAPGYGLIDTRDSIRKRSAFETYKFMFSNLKNSQFLRLDIKRDYYILQCLVEDRLLQIHWSLKPTTLKNEDFFTVYSRDGEIIEDKTLNIGSSPLYIYIKDAV
ncbi:glycosyl hydrolase [Candidatus Sulfurimonas marisnigri]|uniref:Glycosyl hydrolase n=1 Tax=Candidatus Sulfurimonas marisnigri TaxID=2740405 RepID=A0A7S7M1J0_9BACT|nr:glycosyl hydrolase [Candidatus Sulfurimonas marisnigri]QOY55220.1 glycosyl hydrolase [Candidatus Sulfurimonas marisnigri]